MRGGAIYDFFIVYPIGPPDCGTRGDMKIIELQHLQTEGGYLYEIPLIVMLCAIVVAIVGPMLPEPWKTILFAVFGAVAALFLVYHFFFAGWRAKNK